MSPDIHTHLEKLKTELSKLEPAVKHLQQADGNATALITSLSNIHKEFSKHLGNIEKSLSDANEKHQKQLTKEIQESTRKIIDTAELLSKSNSAFENQIKNLLSEYSGLGDATANLIRVIESVDFPKRFDKLDATVSSINQGLQNIQTRIGDLERNIKDDLQAKTKDIISKLDLTENSLLKRSEKQSKEIKVLRILLFVLIGLAIGSIVLQLLKKI